MVCNLEEQRQVDSLNILITIAVANAVKRTGLSERLGNNMTLNNILFKKWSNKVKKVKLYKFGYVLFCSIAAAALIVTLIFEKQITWLICIVACYPALYFKIKLDK